ncbi:RHS repeat-associated core domain-containing protein [Streptomyces sp. NPDC058307]|uniref:RHS repeat-associated core domain-containing protein n=1 Tax=Streptomyces sp. NPDC058307 TaxID=3346439 RepID=UPI0036E1F930
MGASAVAYYTYDATGDILSIADTPSGGTSDVQCFAYDGLGRVSSAWTSSVASNDAKGTGGTDAACSSGASSSTVGGVSAYWTDYGYDTLGNRTSEVRHGLNGTATSSRTYKYDAQGSRLLRYTPTEKTFYLPGTELHYDKSTAKVTATRYYSFAGTTVAMREADGVHFLASDHQGIAEPAVDAKTGATTRRRMDAFGNARDASTSSASGWLNDKGFVGGTVRKSTGLTTLGAREYDSDTGRFISADPIIDYTDPQQINGYAYANNSPVSMSDPTGLESCYPNYSCTRDTIKTINESGTSKDTKAGSGDGGGDSGGSNTYSPAKAKADRARAAEDSAKQKAIAIAKELGKIIADELGITDALDCFTTGNLGACGNTALNVVSSLLSGGGPSLFQDWRKNSKMALSYEEASAKANKALNAKLDHMHATLSRSKFRQYAMGSAAVDRRTGNVVVSLKKTGAGDFCAEDMCRAALVNQGRTRKISSTAFPSGR